MSSFDGTLEGTFAPRGDNKVYLFVGDPEFWSESSEPEFVRIEKQPEPIYNDKGDLVCLELDNGNVIGILMVLGMVCLRDDDRPVFKVLYEGQAKEEVREMIIRFAKTLSTRG